MRNVFVTHLIFDHQLNSRKTITIMFLHDSFKSSTEMDGIKDFFDFGIDSSDHDDIRCRYHYITKITEVKCNGSHGWIRTSECILMRDMS